MYLLDLPEKLETNRLRIERLRYEFAEEIFFAYASKAEATLYVVWPTHENIEATRDYLSYAVSAWSKGTDYSYVIRIKPTNQLVGSIGCMNDQGKVQFGYIISPTFWNQGIAADACRILLAWLRKLNNVHRIWTLTDVDNVSSQRVLLKSGLVEEARLSKWMRFANQGNAPKDCILFKLPDEFLSSHLVSQ